jgi:hypothetical protein
MTLTALIRIIYRDKKVYNTIHPDDKKKYFFMLNKIMSRLYPLAANAINVNGIDEAICVDIWFDNLSRFIDIPPLLEPKYQYLVKKSHKFDLNNDEKYILEKYYPESLRVEKVEDIKNVVVTKKLKKK